ncbi:hypothetical protein K488DRAFT_70141 [Vararia minispora EC-137]|uniref:Uncharacterized protein n=1 Tax=Vararia minispora EC-137 TaxID=1314806 RepID=A0ACB8QN40_9AGAM|nr:hypothetical protein K488DRAFT_70141 [Vararia minispora EC-137]
MEGFYSGATEDASAQEPDLDQLLDPENSLQSYSQPPQSVAIHADITADYAQPPGASSTQAEVQLTVSTAFHPAGHMNNGSPDLTIRTSDGVLFYVHAHIFLSISTNNFNSLLLSIAMGATLTIPESSSVANVLIHAIYGLSCAHFRPPIQDIIAAVDVMTIYGLSVASLLATGTPTFSLILSLAPSHALECYILAARNALEDLAVAVSPYTLRMKLSDLTDATAMRMGPIYLRRLFFLHIGRVEALKRILHGPPGSHPTTESCDDWEQQSLKNAWTLAIGALVWEPDPGRWESISHASSVKTY